MCIRFNRIILFILIVFVTTSCKKNLDGKVPFEGILKGDSNSEGGRAVRVKFIFDGLQEDELKQLTISECRKYGKSMHNFKKTRAALDTDFYSYKCFFSEEDKRIIAEQKEKAEADARRRAEKEREQRLEQQRMREVAEEEREKEVEQISKENRENNLNNAKLECEEIGFKKGTEAFGECVLDLTE